MKLTDPSNRPPRCVCKGGLIQTYRHVEGQQVLPVAIFEAEGVIAGDVEEVALDTHCRVLANEVWHGHADGLLPTRFALHVDCVLRHGLLSDAFERVNVFIRRRDVGQDQLPSRLANPLWLRS